MRKLSFLFVIVLMLIASKLQASTPPDSCLKFLIVEGQAEANIDSIRVDSCSGSPSFGRMFARDRFVFGFAKRLMNLPSRDSVHLFATIADIDTTQRALIDSLYALQNRIGMLRFYSRNVIDTLANGEQVIVLRTVTFHEPDTIIAILKNLPQSLGASFQPRMNLVSSVDPTLEQNKGCLYSMLYGSELRVGNTCKTSEAIISVSVYNLLGAMPISVVVPNNSVLDISTLPYGVYVVMLDGIGTMINYTNF